jgi:hypothetical protein
LLFRQTKAVVVGLIVGAVVVGLVDGGTTPVGGEEVGAVGVVVAEVDREAVVDDVTVSSGASALGSGLRGAVGGEPAATSVPPVVPPLKLSPSMTAKTPMPAIPVKHPTSLRRRVVRRLAPRW